MAGKKDRDNMLVTSNYDFERLPILPAEIRLVQLYFDKIAELVLLLDKEG